MRVAYVCTDRGVPVFGRKGCSIHVQEILRTMVARDWDVDLFAASVSDPAVEGLENVPVHALPVVCDSASDPAADISDCNAALYEALLDRGPYDLIYERYSLWSYAAQELALLSGVASVVEVNAPLIDEAQRYRNLRHADVADRITRRCFQAARSLVAVSDEVGDWLRSRVECSGRVHVVPNGVAPGLAHDVDDRPETPFTIGFAGSLKPWHGTDILVDAFRIFTDLEPSARLLIIGDGPERESLVAQIHDCCGVNPLNVTMTGALPHAEVARLLSQVHVAVAPYPDLAGFYFSPLKIMEYMAAGCAVVASDLGAPARLIEDGRTGLLCRPGCALELAEAMLRLFHDKCLRRSLALCGQQEVLSTRTWDHVLQRIVHTSGLAATHH